MYFEFIIVKTETKCSGKFLMHSKLHYGNKNPFDFSLEFSKNIAFFMILRMKLALTRKNRTTEETSGNTDVYFVITLIIMRIS